MALWYQTVFIIQSYLFLSLGFSQRIFFYVLTVIYHEIISMFPYSDVPFLRNNRLLLCFFNDFYFPPKNSGENIRSASGFFIAGIPFRVIVLALPSKMM